MYFDMVILVVLFCVVITLQNPICYHPTLINDLTHRIGVLCLYNNNNIMMTLLTNNV